MSDNKNTPERPLMEALEDSFRSVLQSAKFEDRTVNQAQYMVLREICDTLTTLIGGEPKITLHPAFSAGYITIKVSDLSLNVDEITTLRSELEKCSALSIEPLTNGNIEIGVTVPGVFYPLET